MKPVSLEDAIMLVGEARARLDVLAARLKKLTGEEAGCGDWFFEPPENVHVAYHQLTKLAEFIDRVSASLDRYQKCHRDILNLADRLQLTSAKAIREKLREPGEYL